MTEDQILTEYSRVQHETAFKGARYDYKIGFKNLKKGPSDAIACKELRFLQMRSAAMLRNSGYARTALNKSVTNTQSVRTLWKQEGTKKQHKWITKLWKEFTTNCTYDGFGNYDTLQELSNKSIFLGGASYIWLRTVPMEPGKVPLKLDILNAQQHDIFYTTKDAKGQVTRYGITFEDGIPQKYWFRKRMDLFAWDDFEASKAVAIPARDLVHTFIRDEPGQWLGIPALTPVLMNLYAVEELIEATIQQQHNAKMFSWVVERDAPFNMQAPTAIGNIKDTTDVDGLPKRVIEQTAGGTQYLNRGERLKTAQGVDIGNNLLPLIESELRIIAETLDIAYHEMTGNTNGLNFSSIQKLAVNSRKRIEYLYNFVYIPLRETKIAQRFKEYAILVDPRCKNAEPYFQLPRYRGIDDLKDAQADVLELQNGLTTVTNALAERNLTLEDIIADKENREVLKEMGIVFETASSSKQMAQAKPTEADSNSTGE